MRNSRRFRNCGTSCRVAESGRERNRVEQPWNSAGWRSAIHAFTNSHKTWEQNNEHLQFEFLALMCIFFRGKIRGKICNIKTRCITFPGKDVPWESPSCGPRVCPAWRGDRVRPVAATQPRARAPSSRRSRFWPHGLVTRVGHTGWPHRMAKRPHGTWAAWNLPPVFRWRHPTTGDEIIVMNEQGYGR
eukprot:COSAG02_NODE_958_length_15648_cov_5.487620_2_plen_188_part_00